MVTGRARFAVNDNSDHGPAGPQMPPAGYALRVYPVDDASEVTLADLWATLRGGRWLIGASVLALTALAGVAAFLITPVYRAQVVMAPVADEQKGGGLSSLAGQLGGLASLAGITVGGSQSNTAEAIATLKSRAFTERFIAEKNLLVVLFAEDWDAGKNTWTVTDPRDVPTLWDGVERFDKSVREVTQDSQTGLVTMSIDWPDPQLAAEWANAMVTDVNATLRRKAIEQSEKNLKYLTAQLAGTTELELRGAIYGLMQAEMRNAMFASGKTEFAFRVIDPAVVPEKNVWPNKILFIVLGLSAGLLLGVFATFVRGAVSPRS